MHHKLPSFLCAAWLSFIPSLNYINIKMSGENIQTDFGQDTTRCQHGGNQIANAIE
jgi:hypothetical protein